MGFYNISDGIAIRQHEGTTQARTGGRGAPKESNECLITPPGGAPCISCLDRGLISAANATMLRSCLVMLDVSSWADAVAGDHPAVADVIVGHLTLYNIV